ncbi:MAG: hypothetical protein H6822_07780 [Planctomycetaceae bacterium]|nr:hypothetical protein [Planctomycetaceae bacterium]
MSSYSGSTSTLQADGSWDILTAAECFRLESCLAQSVLPLVELTTG